MVLAGRDGTVYVNSGKWLYIVNYDRSVEWIMTRADRLLMVDSEGTIYTGNDLSAYYYNTVPKWKGGAEPSNYSYSVMDDRGHFYMVSGLDLVAMDSNGSFLWNYRVGEDTQSSPAIGQDGTIYVRGRESDLCAVRPNGTEKWRMQFGTLYSHTYASPAVGPDGTIYTYGITDPEKALHPLKANQDMGLYAVTPDGSIKWVYNGVQPTRDTPAIGVDGTVYLVADVATSPQGSYGISAIAPSGLTEWVFILPAGPGVSLGHSPVIDGDDIIYYASDNDADRTLYAIGSNGSLLWQMELSRAAAGTPVIGADRRLYLTTQDGYLLAIGE